VNVHDISVPIHPRMIVYEGNPGVELERVDSIPDGAHANVSRLELGVHTGTHVDAPLHFIEGAPGSESLELEPLIGPATVVDATSAAGDLDAATLESLDIPAGIERLLLKTTNGRLWDADTFTRDFIRLTGSGARFLIEKNVRVVGIDFLSIGDGDAHRELLGAGVVPIEGLDLRAIEPGEYQLVCLPIRLEGSDGAPARAVLLPLGR
jgi:arylformamidase